MNKRNSDPLVSDLRTRTLATPLNNHVFAVRQSPAVGNLRHVKYPRKIHRPPRDKPIILEEISKRMINLSYSSLNCESLDYLREEFVTKSSYPPCPLLSKGGQKQTGLHLVPVLDRS